MLLKFTDALKSYQAVFKECYITSKDFDTHKLWDAMMCSLKAKYELSKIKH